MVAIPACICAERLLSLENLNKGGLTDYWEETRDVLISFLARIQEGERLKLGSDVTSAIKNSLSLYL